MNFEYSLGADLPPLAWLATIDSRADVCEVVHGKYVECRPSFFFEGAWGGDFALGRPDATEVAFGSGACATEDGVTFVSSLATTDYLYYRISDTRLSVANSLAFLLASLEDELDPHYFEYAENNNSIMSGIHDYRREIPTRRGGVRRLLSVNLRWTRGELVETQKPEPPDFRSYSEYVAYVRGSYAELVQNARHSARRTPLRIFTTQSRGYDSTAINAIAAEHGIDGVFTVRTGKGGGSTADHRDEREVSDDGTEIAQQLGIGPVIGLERRAFVREFDDELLFLASIHESQDANLKQVAEYITAPALLLTGTLGEVWYSTAAWYREHPQLADGDLRRADLAGHGLTEVRLRYGYVQAAIPYIGARRRAQIIRITDSAEMDDWRLGTTYDRPVARRIAEEAGVARLSFGQVKVGSVVEFSMPQVPQSTALREQYASFLSREGILRRWQVRLLPAARWLNEIIWFASEEYHRWMYYTMRAVSRLRRRDTRFPFVWNWLRGSLFCFAVNKQREEYVRALASVDKAQRASGRP